ncbi:MAG: alpha/beta fold hydrolase [Bacteroidetes bacterium]|nr:MAG: alpha/beta fold hydrolase [Bacteroidota bacterium]
MKRHEMDITEAQIPGTDIAYLRAGRGRLGSPPVILVHGAYTDGHMWTRNLLPYLAARGFAVYAIHLKAPGWGPLTLWRYTLGSYVRRLRRLADHVGDPPVLIGHSMGGLVIQKYLSRYPGEAAGAALLASLPPFGLRHTLTNMLRRPRLLLAYMMITFLPSLVRRLPGDPPPGLLSARVPAADRAYFGTLLQRESFLALAHTLRPGVREGAVRQVPLWVCGADQDNLALPADVRDTAARYHVKAVIRPESGHFLVLEPDWTEMAEELVAVLLRPA